MLGGADGAGLDCELPLFDDPIGRFFHHLLEQHPQVGVFPIIGRRDVSDAVGVRGKLITFLETQRAGIVGIVNRNRLSSVFLHHGEARDIGGPVADVNNVRKGNRPNFRIHVVVHVLRHIEKPFVNAEEKLSLLGVTNDALGEADAAFGISGEFATENGANVRREPAAIDQHL